MILDSSVIIAIARNEPSVSWVEKMLRLPDARRMSWVSIAEVDIRICGGGELRVPTRELLYRLWVEPLADSFAVVDMVVEARLKFPINLGDCFAYAHAKLLSEPLLTLDADFLKTDLPRVLHPDRTP